MSPVPTSNRIESSQATSDSQVEKPASWQRQLAGAIRSSSDLLQRLNLNHSVHDLDLESPHGTGQPSSFPTLVPESFLQRMEPGNINDPLLRQVLIDAREFDAAAGFVDDPVDDTGARKATGLLQKYDGRALLITSGACAVHCRYCFRREYPYHEEPKRLEDWEPALQHVAADTSISEILLSGGDPLMLSDSRLAELCQRIDSIAHIQRIRIHTRLPIVLPARITSDLISTLTELRSQPVMVVHANHANEIAGDCRKILQKLVRSGLPVLNQAVLLRGINDSADALAELCLKLVNIGVMPYYLHQLDRVAGAAHFEASESEGSKLIKEIAKRLPGYAVPKFVREVAGADGKTPIFS